VGGGGGGERERQSDGFTFTPGELSDLMHQGEPLLLSDRTSNEETG